MISKSPKVLYFFGAYLRLFFLCFKRRGPYLSSPAYIFQKHSGHNQKLFSIHLPKTLGTQPRNARHTSSKLPVFFFQKYSGSIKKLHGISPCISFRNIRYKFLESLLHLSLRRSQQKTIQEQT